MPKSHWIKGSSIGGPGSIVSTYIKRGNPSFGVDTKKPRIFLLLAAAKEGEELLHSCTITKEEEGGSRAAAPEGRRRRAVAAAGRCLVSGLHLFINLSIKLLITMTMCE